eukprot:CAMPEP_0178909398 /NCGR_PEP_ID=MMETSP0786-20121207/8490_1 /TAXON_ID=186022 /ORGANISM="Thalassionema frauenfeldii, Strain CCMP 1798" /LENGTH=139 /DNA_ID=CAMNT_0020581475 /DNA_START=227 /DNA_END=642 /DNA_ORIENTATION=+
MSIHCLGDSSYNNNVCIDKQVEYVSRVYASGSTTFTYRVTDADTDSNNRPKDVSIGWTGTCCVESATYFSDDDEITGGENSDTCVKGIKFGKNWEISQTQPEIFTLVVAGNVPEADDASNISINMNSGNFCLYSLPGPS